MLKVGDKVAVNGMVVAGLMPSGRVGVAFDGPGKLYSEVHPDACTLVEEAPAPAAGTESSPAVVVSVMPATNAGVETSPEQTEIEAPAGADASAIAGNGPGKEPEG